MRRQGEIVDGLRERYRSVVVEDKGTLFNSDLTQALELGFLLELAECMVVSGVARQESRGAHARPYDYPSRDDENFGVFRREELMVEQGEIVRGLRENRPPVSAKGSESTTASAASMLGTASTVTRGPKSSSRSSGESPGRSAATVGAATMVHACAEIIREVRVGAFDGCDRLLNELDQDFESIRRAAESLRI